MLHLLRRVPPAVGGRPVDPEVLIRALWRWRRVGREFGSWTTRRPRRLAERDGGSVFFVAGGYTLFRLPLVCVEPIEVFAKLFGLKAEVPERFAGGWSFTCRCQVTLVESRRVYRLRGWRYLDPADAPPDLGV